MKQITTTNKKQKFTIDGNKKIALRNKSILHQNKKLVHETNDDYKGSRKELGHGRKEDYMRSKN
jgi:hypothetical protein